MYAQSVLSATRASQRDGCPQRIRSELFQRAVEEACLKIRLAKTLDSSGGLRCNANGFLQLSNRLALSFGPTQQRPIAVILDYRQRFQFHTFRARSDCFLKPANRGQIAYCV